MFTLEILTLKVFTVDLTFKLSIIAGGYLAMLSRTLCSICGVEVQNFHFPLCLCFWATMRWIIKVPWLGPPTMLSCLTVGPRAVKLTNRGLKQQTPETTINLPCSSVPCFRCCLGLEWKVSVMQQSSGSVLFHIPRGKHKCSNLEMRVSSNGLV